MSDLKDYGQLITQIGKTATKYADQIAKNLCIVDQVFTGIGKQLAIISDRFYQIFENAVKGLDEFERISKIFSMIVLEAGWPPHGGFYPSEIRDTVEQYGKVTKTKLNKLIQQLYINKFDADEIGAMLQNWDQQKWLKRRMPILKEAITAHFEGRYTLSICALLPQIEGIITSGYCLHGWVTGRSIDSLQNNAFQ